MHVTNADIGAHSQEVLMLYVTGVEPILRIVYMCADDSHDFNTNAKYLHSPL